MAEIPEVRVMMLGDQSICMEHFVRPFYNYQTGEDSRCVLDICESKGIEVDSFGNKTRLNIRIATTRSASSRLPTDKIRANDYARRMINIDAILLFFYQNNSKTVFNVSNKYLEEVKSTFPKVPYFLLSLRIEDNVNGVKKPLRETISVEDRWLKRELDVDRDEGLQIMKKIKAKRFFEVKVARDFGYNGWNDIPFDYNLNECYNLEKPFQEIIRYVLKKRNGTILKNIRKCLCCCCRHYSKARRREEELDEFLLDE